MTKSGKTALFFVIAFFVAICAHSQIQHLYTMQLGLRSSYVNSVMVDADNYLWVATDNSMEMFDGHRFIKIDSNAPDGKPMFEVINLICERDANFS